MFICDDSDGATFTASLAPDADPERPSEVWLCASRRADRMTHDRIYVSLSPASIRGLITELAVMLDEIETAQLEAEVADADNAEAAAWCFTEWRTAAGHLTCCAELRGHDGPHSDALGHTQPAAADPMPPGNSAADYVHVQLWGKFLGSLPGYISSQQRAAYADRAPVNAIYRATPPAGDRWMTTDDVTNPAALDALRIGG